MDNEPIGDCDDLGLPNCVSTPDDPGDNFDFAGGGLENIFSTFFLVIGFLATLYLIIAGIQYAASAGDPNKARQAKDSIIYALIGVVLSFSLAAILRFLFTNETPGLGL